jgi:hypothetical protein
MKLDIIKGYSKEGGRLVTEYSIRKKLFGFIPYYQMTWFYNTSPTHYRVGTFFITLFASGFTFSFAILYLIKSEYLNVFYASIIQLALLYWYNITFAKTYKTLEEAQAVVQDEIKYQLSNKEVVEKYTLSKNELTIQKQNDTEQ